MTQELRDPSKAVDFIIKNSVNFAAAKSQRVYLDEFRKSKKAILMSQSTAKSSVEREQYAYAHDEYLALLEGIRAAVEAEEKLRWMLIAAQAEIEVWRSMEASNRNQDRTMR